MFGIDTKLNGYEVTSSDAKPGDNIHDPTKGMGFVDIRVCIAEPCEQSLIRLISQ